MMHEHAILCIGISIRAALLSVESSLLNMGLDYCDFSVMYRQFTIIYEMKWKTTFLNTYIQWQIVTNRNVVVLWVQEVKIKYTILAGKML